MDIAAIETVTFDDESEITNTERDVDITVLRVHTSNGYVGLGETFPQAGMEEAALHGPIADRVLGRDANNVEAIRDDLTTYFNYYGHAGAEFRATSALDIALWDLKGQRAGEPIYQLLGGSTREKIPTYNTCYDRKYDFKEDPVALAESLLNEGITSMKIWPFDEFAERTCGQRISTQDLKTGLEPLHQIREAVGDRMDIAVEFHGLWSLTPAKKLVEAVAEYNPIWVEDVIRKGDIDAYRRLAEATDAPMCVSERLVGQYEFVQAIRTGVIDVVMMDLCWTGGLSTGKAVASMAESAHLPIAPHNSGGPILHFANAHLAAAVPNLYVMETIRSRYDGWHRNLITDPLSVKDGALPLPEGSGLGTAFNTDLFDHPDVTVRRTDA